MIDLILEDPSKRNSAWFTGAYATARYEWYPVLAKGGKEFQACAELQNQGYVAISPFYRAERKPHSQVVKLKRPLYCGYVFVGVPAGFSVRPILSTRGVRDMVRVGQTIMQLSFDSMAHVAKCFGPDGDSGLLDARHSVIERTDGIVENFLVADKVVMKSGAWRGFEMVVEAVLGRDRYQLGVDSSKGLIKITAHAGLLHSETKDKSSKSAVAIQG